MAVTNRGKPSNAAALLAYAQEAAKLLTSWQALHNAIYGNGGRFGELFTDQDSRTAFAKSTEFKQIAEILQEKRKSGSLLDDEPASGKFVLRLPVSMHAALVAEAKAEGVSLNQLCVAKLAMSLQGMVRRSAESS